MSLSPLVTEDYIDITRVAQKGAAATMDTQSSTSGEPQSPFLNLPPELRERIYHIHFSDLPEQGPFSKPTEPPLTQVSQILRTEALPIFYSAYFVLTIQSYIKCDFYGHVSLTTRKWYHGLHADKVKHLRRFRLRFGLIQQYTGELVPIEFQISLWKKQKPGYSLSQSFDQSWHMKMSRLGDPADFEDVLLVFRRHLREVVEALLRDPGVGELRVEDLDRLARVDPNSLPITTSS